MVGMSVIDIKTRLVIDMAKRGRKKKYVRKICGECGKQKSKKKMEYIGRKWYCEGCKPKPIQMEQVYEVDEENLRNGLETCKEYGIEMPELEELIDEIEREQCPVCGSVMIDMKGYWKCIGCGGFTRSD